LFIDWYINCLDLYNSNDATEEICNKAKTTTDKKICSLKSDNSGCDEFSKQESDSGSTPGSNPSQGAGKYLDLFAIGLIVLQYLLL